MRLTHPQVLEMQSKGLKMDQIEALAKKNGYEMPDNRDGLEKAGAIVNAIFPGKQIGESVVKTATNIGNLATGGIDKFEKGLPENTVDVPALAGDYIKAGATVASAVVPNAPGIVGKAAQFGALGGVSGFGEGLTKGKSGGQLAGEVVKNAAVGAATGAAFGAAEKGFVGLGNLLGKTGDKIQTSVIKPTAADIKDGFSLDTVNKYNLGGSLKTTFTKTESKLDDLSRQLNGKLKSSNASVDLNHAYEATVKRLMGNKLESFGANTQMEGAIGKLRDEIIAASGENGIVSIPEAQIIKRASGHFGAWSYGVPTPEATASQKVYNTFYNELKESIEKHSPEGVREINKEISKLIPVMNALIRRIPVAERNAALSLTDIISLTAATMEPRALSLSLINLASKSGAVGAALSKNAPKAGQAVAKGLGGAERIVRTIQAR
jgi:hypothetical protein